MTPKKLLSQTIVIKLGLDTLDKHMTQSEFVRVIKLFTAERLVTPLVEALKNEA